MNAILRQKVENYSDGKLAKELAFARGFAPPITQEEQAWLDALEAEQKRRGALER
jgi:hypothetical protein